MKRSHSSFRVGLALTFACTLLFVMVFSLDGTMSWVQGSAEIQVRFPNAQGLMNQDPVHFHGVPCGRVISLAFSTGAGGSGDGAEPSGPGVAFAEDNRRADDVSVLLTIEVPPEVRGYLREGSLASIQKTLTGVAVVNLEQGIGGPLPEGRILEGTPEATISDVASAMEGAVATLTEVLEEFRPIVTQIREDDLISETVTRFGDAADEVKDLAEQLERTFDDLDDPIVALTERAGELIGEFERSAAEIPETIADLRGSVRGARDLVEDMRRVVRTASPEWQAASEDLAATSANARDLTEEIRRRPWRLLKAPNSSDAAAIDLYETAARYADGAVEVRRALELVQGALARRGTDAEANNQLSAALALLEESLTQQQSVERMFWERFSGEK